MAHPGHDAVHVQSRLVTPDPELEAAIALGYQRRDRADMAPTIAYFEGLLAEHPGHPVLTYEVAGAYDTAGQETEARICYEEALRLGLSGEESASVPVSVRQHAALARRA